MPPNVGSKYMQKHIGWLWTIGFFALLGAANAQTASPSVASTQYDGTYAFVSSANVNETWRDFSNRERSCGYHLGGPLIILNGQARYTAPRRDFEGTVGPQGELTMRAATGIPAKVGWGSPGIERLITGRIDGSGTVRARLMRSNACRFDLIWQKQSQ
jgi:hypothetical protein